MGAVYASSVRSRRKFDMKGIEGTMRVGYSLWFITGTVTPVHEDRFSDPK